MLWQHRILKDTFSNLYREGGKKLVACFLLPLKREREKKMSNTCSLFPPFADPWLSCLLPSLEQSKNRQVGGSLWRWLKFKLRDEG